MLNRVPLLVCVSSLTLPAQSPNLSIAWVGQSCFVLRSDGGPTVVADPPSASLGYTLRPLNADAVTITHNHSDVAAAQLAQESREGTGHVADKCGQVRHPARAQLAIGRMELIVPHA